MAHTEVIKANQLDQMLEYLFDGIELELASPEAIQLDMVRQIMAAETLEEAFSEFKSTPMEDMEGTVLHVHGVAWARSAYEAGAPIFGLVRVTADGSDKPIVVSCGGATVITRLRWAQLHNAMPFKVVFAREQSQQNPEYKYWTAKLV